MPVTSLPLGGSTDPGNGSGWTLCPGSPPPRHSQHPVFLATSQGDGRVCPQIAELETEKRDLERQVNEQKAKCEATEKRETERRQVEEKKHNEEIQFLKRTNQQLKVSPCTGPGGGAPARHHPGPVGQAPAPCLSEGSKYLSPCAAKE